MRGGPRKGRKAKKPFAVLSRHPKIGGTHPGALTKWRVWSRYETAERRDEAMKGFKRKYARYHWEFRANTLENE